MLIPQTPHHVDELEVDGKRLFGEWLKKLRDPVGKAAILTRIRRIQTVGSFGDYRYLESGVFELKIDVGPGYRAYFGLDGGSVVLMVIGGDKSTQNRDIRRAVKLWQTYGASRGKNNG